jgi:integrase/recombinase XerD
MSNSRHTRLIKRVEDWPPVDQTSWLALFVRGGPLDEDGPRAGWCALTRTAHAASYGRWLGFIDRIGQLDPDLAPSSRITKERIGRYIDHLRESVASVTLARRLDHLSLVARSFAPACDLQWLVRVCQRLRARAKPKSRPPPPRSGDVYRAARIHMTKAEAIAVPKIRAATFRNGLAIAMLTAVPIRSRNLAMIEVGRHLTRRGEEYWLTFEAQEMKNRRPFECPLPVALVESIERYLQVHRPVLGGHLSTRLFINVWGEPISTIGLSERVKTATKRILGRAMNVHEFRRMATTNIAIHDPSHIGTATPLLGHVSPQITTRHYNMAKGIEAGRTVGAALREMRRTCNDPGSSE